MALDEDVLGLSDGGARRGVPTDRPADAVLRTCQCPDAQPVPPTSYCPSTNTIAVDLGALQQMGEVADESNYVLLQGDNTALSVLTSRYALAVQHESGDALDTPGGSAAHGVPDRGRPGRDVRHRRTVQRREPHADRR